MINEGQEYLYHDIPRRGGLGEITREDHESIIQY